MSIARSRKAFSIAGALLLLSSLAMPFASATDTAQENQPAPTFVADGSSSAKAATSCFEVKKNNPTAASGSYWLYTPQMSAPERFYCDQETDGGGWVLIGRGREGWSSQYAGIGTADSLASNPDGTDAFEPVQLPSLTIDALLGGKSPSDLPADGMRIKRSSSVDGQQNQEVRLHRDRMERWSWEFTQTAQYSNLTIKGPETDFSSPSTFSGKISATSPDSLSHITFKGTANSEWNNGFAYGPNVLGTSAADSYLWTSTDNSGNATPFAQMFIRPELTQDTVGMAPIADEGSPASTSKALPNSYSEKVQWRTSDTTASGSMSELNTFVQAIDQVGDTVFTAGDFEFVENATTGEKVQQPYIAGYNVNSGELLRTFMPKFNGQIKALAALPTGQLVVGGEFTKVNDLEYNGLVVLNPQTGEIDTSYDWRIQTRLSGGVVKVMSFDVQGDYLYVGGQFTHVKGNTSEASAYSKNATRFNLKTKSVDWKWRPLFNGTVNGISANEAGSDVYASGYFSTLNSEPALRLANLDTQIGKMARPWSWQPSYLSDSVTNAFQQDVKAGDGTVWAGGSEHLVHNYNANDLSLISSSITISGGDFQDLLINNGVVYGSCHCGDAIFQGASQYKDPETQSTNIDQVRLVVAFDEKTGKVLGEFNPQISGLRGQGVWEQFIDSTGTLWVGGDINKTLGKAGIEETVGFARYAPRDVKAPETPTDLKITTEEGRDRLTWAEKKDSTDVYQVLKNNRVIATVWGASFDTEHEDGARYFVRTMDKAGNYSATTPVAVATVSKQNQPDAPSTLTPVPTTEPTLAPAEAPLVAPSLAPATAPLTQPEIGIYAPALLPDQRDVL